MSTEIRLVKLANPKVKPRCYYYIIKDKRIVDSALSKRMALKRAKQYD